ncbi:MAG: hypothetical protein IJQ02_11635 [Oscillospiraceae bacterium]|nr:hypothetical protein [Oscillospiraceae bacterium]
MPRTKLGEPKYPPVDWLKAAILERKDSLELTWGDLADVAGITNDSMRRLASLKPPEEWPPDVRRAVLRRLGIHAKLVIVDEHALKL